jgi:hypothetical protein
MRDSKVLHNSSACFEHAVVGASRRAADPHPHPVAPFDLAAASSAQHALVPAVQGRRSSLQAYAGCVSGAALIAEVEGMLRVQPEIWATHSYVCRPACLEAGRRGHRPKVKN